MLPCGKQTKGIIVFLNEIHMYLLYLWMCNISICICTPTSIHVMATGFPQKAIIVHSWVQTRNGKGGFSNWFFASWSRCFGTLYFQLYFFLYLLWNTSTEAAVEEGERVDTGHQLTRISTSTINLGQKIELPKKTPKEMVSYHLQK